MPLSSTKATMRKRPIQYVCSFTPPSNLIQSIRPCRFATRIQCTPLLTPSLPPLSSPPAFGKKFFTAFFKIDFDLLRGLRQRRFRHHIMAVGVDFDGLETAPFSPVSGSISTICSISSPNRINRHAVIFQMRREKFDRVAAHAEIAAPESDIVALVLQRDQPGERIPAAGCSGPSPASTPFR